MTLAATLTLLAVAAVASASDVMKRRVSNRLNLAILALGLGWRAVADGGWSPALGLAGAAVGLAALLGPFAARWIGAGDVKLLAALGAWMGPVDVLWTALYGLAGGGLLAALLALTSGAEVRTSVAANLQFTALSLSAPAAPARARSLLVPLAVPLSIAACALFIARGGL